MWWWNCEPRHFPLTQGPYVPGCVDLMSGYGEDSTFVRVYYPTSEEKKDNTSSKWFKWIPHAKYIEGFGQLIKGYSVLVKMAVWYYGGEPLVPCVWEGAPLATKKFPVIAYSHGFGATRFVSATIAAELASFGFLTASIEHRDTSAAATYYYANEQDRDNDVKTWIQHGRLKLGPEHYPLRNKQLHKRVDEMQNLINYLENINKGTAENIIKTNFDLKLFKDRLDLNKLTMMGHSFGGATSILTLKRDERPKGGVILDGWMFPLKEEKLSLDKPMLYINTQSFHIESNLTFMNKLINEPNKSNKEAYTLRYTTHETHTDSPFIMGYWLDWFQKKLDPAVGTNLNNFLTLRFYQKYLDFPEDIEKEKKYLEENENLILEGTHLFVKGQQVPVSQ